MSVNLYVKSYYSLLESTLSLQDILQFTAKSGMDAVALCDHNVMYGSIAFYRAAMKKGIKPILGIEADVMDHEESFVVCLYARNNAGYRRIMELSTRLNTGETALKMDDIIHNNDIIVVFPSENSFFEKELLQRKENELLEKLLYLKSNIHHVYVGLSSNEEAFYSQRNIYLKAMCRRVDMKCVALEKALYLSPEDTGFIKAVDALKHKTTVNDQNLENIRNKHLHNTEEYLQFYEREEILNTDEIAKMCEIDLDEMHCDLLHYPNKYNVDNRQYLRELCVKGLKKRFNNGAVPEVYITRLNYELSVISKMKYDDYFLIVYDFIRYAKSQGIYVGPGRGSAAGSIVAWTLGITHIDPIEYSLLFERFLNPERISMPDIDVDFPDERRQEVIDYVMEKYGRDRVAHIIAFSTMQAKAAIDAACEALGVEKRRLDYAKRFLPQVIKDKSTSALAETYQTNYKFKQMIDSEDDLSRVYHLALRLEKMPKNITTHACGIVMSDKPLTDVIPLCDVNGEMLSTQISAEYLEDLGLLKMDFLGIRNLTIIDRVCNEVQPPIDILKIPLDDPKAYALLSNADTVGIFQLESEGMKNLLRKVRPKNLSELSDCLALYRPASMENIPLYLKNKEHPETITYLHESLKDILKPTYGILIYQEQIMQLTQKTAGFSLGKADIVRKAISKKKEKELLALQDDFMKGCYKNGYSKELSEELYGLILKFGGYGFNKSHSVAYSLVAYQMAYLKANYPLLFLGKLMDNVIGAEGKTYEYLLEARKLKVNVLPISINRSEQFYTVEENGIRMPLRCIKKMGANTAELILKERKERGDYKDFFDFVARANVQRLNRGNIESLIDAGALDEFGYNRATLRASLDDALKYAELIKVDNPDQSYLDFDLVYKPRMTVMKEVMDQKLEREQAALGFYISKHPIELLKERFPMESEKISNLSAKTGRVSLLVRIQRVKNHTAKTGSMAFLTIDDESGSMNAVVLPNNYLRYQDILTKGNLIYLTGRVDNKGNNLSVVVDKMERILG